VGCLYRMKKSPFWWMKWIGVDGRAQYESSKTTDHKTAKGMLAQREGKVAQGEPVTSAVGRLKFNVAADDLEKDFKTHGRKTLDEVERRLRLHLRPFFGRYRMVDITTPLIRRYIDKRQKDTLVIRKARTIRHPDGGREQLPELTKPVSPAEINRELQVLKRTFNLARKEGRLLYTPYVPMLREDNVRQGFVDREQLADILDFLPSDLRPVVQFAFLTGWRMASEVLPLEWSRVDFEANEVRLDPGTTKNGEGRVFPMNADLRALLETQHAAHKRLAKRGMICPRVFVRMVADERGGTKKPRAIIRLDKAWKVACAAAGLPGRIIHDLRRSAIRNMVRDGVPETVAMKLSGHKTRSVFDRYNITSNRDLHEAAARLTGLQGTTAGTATSTTQRGTGRDHDAQRALPQRHSTSSSSNATSSNARSSAVRPRVRLAAVITPQGRKNRRFA